MKNLICYYSGTGNSLWAARQLAAGPCDAAVVALRSVGEALLDEADTLGLVFPVHMWGVPRAVVAFVNALPRGRLRRCWAVATHGGQVAGTLLELERLLRARDIALAAGYGVRLPSNYIPWGGPGPIEGQQALFREAMAKLRAIGAELANGDERPPERGPLWQRAVFTPLHRLSFPHVPRMDAKLWCDDRCNGCGVCAKVCPADNVRLAGGRPTWLHRCEQCFACLQWCPMQAIQYGRRTPGYERYHHPEVSLRDFLEVPKPNSTG